MYQEQKIATGNRDGDSHLYKIKSYRLKKTIENATVFKKSSEI